MEGLPRNNFSFSIAGALCKKLHYDCLQGTDGLDAADA